MLKELKAGSYDFFLKADKAAYRSIKMMGHGSAYYVGLHLKGAGYEHAARFYFELGQKQYEAPFNRLCREQLYETGTAIEQLQSVEMRLAELTKQDNSDAQKEKAQLNRLKRTLLLQTATFDAITESPEELYLAEQLTETLNQVYPQFEKKIPPFIRSLAEIRLLVFQKRYEQAWHAVQEVFTAERTFTELDFPLVVSDSGKAGVYGAENTAAAADFFERAAAQIWEATGHKRPVNTATDIQVKMQKKLFYALFYAGRCRVKSGGTTNRKRACELFLQAADYAVSDSDIDSALWYYIDTARNLGTQAYLSAMCNTVTRWQHPAWYTDVVQSLQAMLSAAQNWNGLETLYKALAQTDLPEQRAAAAYTLAASGALSAHKAEYLLKEAANSSHKALYYRILAAYRLGSTLFTDDAGLSQRSSYSPHSSRDQRTAGHTQREKRSTQGAVCVIEGLLQFGLYHMVYPHITMLRTQLPSESVMYFARVLSNKGYYADAMRLISFSLQQRQEKANREELEFLYPRPWHDLVSKYAAEYRLPEYLLYAVMRSESFFQPQIVSAAGAIGLTQLMPATAADIAKKLKISSYQLTEPETNIKFGAYYLSEMIRRSDNRIMPACFAYNAGLARVRTWQKKRVGMTDDLFLESLDYAETRGYGRKILSAAVLYGALYYSEKPEDIIRLFFQNLHQY